MRYTEPQNKLPADQAECTLEQFLDYQAYRVVGGVVVALPADSVFAMLKARLAEEATAKRWALEIGGVLLPNGVRVGSDREDQNAIANAVSVIALTGLAEIDFKAVSGWVRIGKAELEAIAAAVGRHKQACYSAERLHHEAIAGLQDVEAARAYDVNAGWPG